MGWWTCVFLLEKKRYLVFDELSVSLLAWNQVSAVLRLWATLLYSSPGTEPVHCTVVSSAKSKVSALTHFSKSFIYIKVENSMEKKAGD